MAAIENLSGIIDTKNLACLNDDAATPFSAQVFTNSGSKDPLQSDADAELLFTVPFTRVVRVHSIEVRGPKGNGPKIIKLFAGQRGFSFDDAHTYKATQTITLSQNDLDGKRIDLQYNNFQKLDCLTIFVEDNQTSDDITSLYSISLFGSVHGVMNMCDLKKVG